MPIVILAKDNFSVYEQDALVRKVEEKLTPYSEIVSVYARSGGSTTSDTIGSLQLELAEWDTRRPVALIAEDIRADMSTIPGIDVQVQTDSGGPGGGKPINLKVLSKMPKPHFYIFFLNQVRFNGKLKMKKKNAFDEIG